MPTIAVIGGGPAGVIAALEAASHGATVTLISAEAVGGRATWSSLVPSKVCLTAADHLDDARHQEALGLIADPPRLDLARMRERIEESCNAWSAHQIQLLLDRAVRVVTGKASFVAPDRLAIQRDGDESEVIAFDKAIIATGSVPVFLPSLKPDAKRILAPRLIAKFADWPRHIIIIGGGVTGAEFAYFFRCAGCAVTWITDQPLMLPTFDLEVATALERSLEVRGVEMVKSAPVASGAAVGDGVRITLQDGTALEGSHAFIAIGRRADLADLGLTATGIVHTPAGVRIDAHCRTSKHHIYAAGDAAGPPYTANCGMARARVAARHATGAPTAPFRPHAVIETTYTLPQAAQVGLTESAAAELDRPVCVFRARYGAALKARLGEAAEGFVKLLAKPDDGRLLGGAAFGDRAAEILAPVALAVAKGLSVEDLSETFAAHPTLSELAGIALRGY
ncbi:MAG: NAD(P)/FAD-dependent oxidoreductase [Defluviicoccus sp.]